VTVSDDEEHERARESAEEAGRTAQKRSRAEAERIKAEALTGPMKLEVLRQQGLIDLWRLDPHRRVHGAAVPHGSIARHLRQISIVAFAVAIRLLAALVMVNRQEAFRGRRTPSITVTVAQAVAQAAAFVGIVAGFWHITWIAGVTFLVAGFVAVGIHSAGYIRLEGTREPTS
jgi:hypothetical protein